MGTKVVLVYPGQPQSLNQYAKEFIKEQKLPKHFLFVTDPDYKFTNKYGLRWDQPRETAYPSTLVIDKEQVIRYAKVSKTHGGRPDTKEVLSAIKELK